MSEYKKSSITQLSFWGWWLAG